MLVFTEGCLVDGQVLMFVNLFSVYERGFVPLSLIRAGVWALISFRPLCLLVPQSVQLLSWPLFLALPLQSSTIEPPIQLSSIQQQPARHTHCGEGQEEEAAH